MVVQKYGLIMIYQEKSKDMGRKNGWVNEVDARCMNHNWGLMK